MIAGARGSYALAGAVTATGLAATAVVAPWTARLVDRHGQARIAVPATAIAALGSLALLLCVHYGAPDWTLFASYAATATTPNTGGMSRARWAHLLKGDERRPAHRELLRTGRRRAVLHAGPGARRLPVRDVLPGGGHAGRGGAAADRHAAVRRAALDGTAGAARTAQRQVAPPRARHAARCSPSSSPWAPCSARWRSSRSPSRTRRDTARRRGAVLALQAAGSCAAGLLYGALPQTGAARGAGCPGASPAMTALLTLPLLAAALTGSLPLLAARAAGRRHGDRPDDGHRHDPGPAAHPRGPVERGHDPRGDRPARRDRLRLGGRRLGWWSTLSPTAGFGVPVAAAGPESALALG